MTPYDQQLISQLPVVVLFMIFFFKLSKDHREDIKIRDQEMRTALTAVADTLRILGDRTYTLGLAFVALAGESDPKKAFKAAKDAMEQEHHNTPRGAHGD